MDFGQVTDPFANVGTTGWLAEQVCIAVGLFDDSQQDLNERRFARAILAE